MKNNARRKRMNTEFLSSALIIVDVQNDFCPSYKNKAGEMTASGVLSVKDGDKVVEPLNTVARVFNAYGAPVIATQDWHPAGHISFASSHPGLKQNDIIELVLENRNQQGIGVVEQVLWPDHCVQGTWGAEFHDALDLNPVSFIVRKGRTELIDSYSAFFENDKTTSTGLGGLLKSLSVESVFIGGLATDYCVFYSVMDAVKLGFKTYLLTDAVQGIDYPAGSIQNALKEMERAGVIFVTSGDIK
jgi:nicotinamidase/pyrazinamidase